MTVKHNYMYIQILHSIKQLYVFCFLSKNTCINTIVKIDEQTLRHLTTLVDIVIDFSVLVLCLMSS